MVSVESQVTNKTGTFPATVAKNASGVGATDGTEYVAAVLNNGMWGWLQDLLQQVSMTPSGTTEAAAATGAAAAAAGQQIRQAFEMKYGAPGELVFDCIAPGSGTYGSQAMSWGAATGGPPTRYQYRRVIPANGAVVLIANYPDLCAALYCGDANNATAPYCYKTSDAGGTTRSTSGTYMVLPDFRGVTVRGRDTGAARDPQGASRLIANIQAFAMQAHYHNPLAGTNFINGGSSGVSIGTGASSWTAQNTTGAAVTDGATYEGKVNPAISLASETRMINASCNIGLRY